jgi:Leucine rich repeat
LSDSVTFFISDFLVRAIGGNFISSRYHYFTFQPFRDSIIDDVDYEVGMHPNDKVEIMSVFSIPAFKYLPIKVAEKFPNLKFYFVANCPLKAIFKQNLANLVNLERLSLYKLKIQEIPGDWFEDLRELRRLMLGSNSIRTIDERALRNLKKLEFLDLARNELSAISAKLLENLTELRYLNLKNNKFTAFGDEVFAENSKLTTILLSNNRISKLSSKMFDKMADIEYIGATNTSCLNEIYSKFEEQKEIAEFKIDVAANCI